MDECKPLPVLSTGTSSNAEWMRRRMSASISSAFLSAANPNMARRSKGRKLNLKA